MDNAGEGANSLGVYVGGAAPTTPADPIPGGNTSLHSGHVMEADLTYSQGVLRVELTDTNTGASAVRTYAVDIPRRRSAG